MCQKETGRNGFLPEHILMRRYRTLVSYEQRQDRSASSSARSDRYTRGVSSQNAGLVGAKRTLASHVHYGWRGVRLKPVVHATYRCIRHCGKRIAALCIGRDAQTRIDDTSRGRGSRQTRYRPAEIVYGRRVT